MNNIHELEVLETIDNFFDNGGEIIEMRGKDIKRLTAKDITTKELQPIELSNTEQHKHYRSKTMKKFYSF